MSTMPRTKRLTLVAVTGALLAIVVAVAFAATGGGGSWTPGWQTIGGRYFTYRPAKPAAVRTPAAARTGAQQFVSRLGLRVGGVLQFKLNF